MHFFFQGIARQDDQGNEQDDKKHGACMLQSKKRYFTSFSGAHQTRQTGNAGSTELDADILRMARGKTCSGMRPLPALLDLSVGANRTYSYADPLTSKTWKADDVHNFISLCQNPSPIDFVMYIASTDTPIGFQRTRRIESQCRSMGVMCYRPTPPGQRDKLHGLLQEHTESLEHFRMMQDNQLALLTDDDTLFIPNLKNELKKTIDELPTDWNVFHLCPGYLHGRIDPFNHFDLKPVGDILGQPRISSGGRAFLDWPQGVAHPGHDPNFPSNPEVGNAVDGILAGSPNSMLVTRDGAYDLLVAFGTYLFEEDTLPDDYIERDVGVSHPSTHFVARQPQLCKEGTTLDGQEVVDVGVA
jgi:hypothetical protein